MIAFQQRADFQKVMVRHFKQVVEEETGRKVAALMSGSHQHPDLICETFVLAPTDVLDEHTGTSSPTSSKGGRLRAGYSRNEARSRSWSRRPKTRK